MTFSDPQSHSEPLFKSLDILKFDDLITINNVIFIKNALEANLPTSVLNAFMFDADHSYNTRANLTGLINLSSFITTSFGKNSIRHQSITSWNNLIPSINFPILQDPLFKVRRSLKAFFIDLYK